MSLNNMKLIHALSDNLERLKGFSTGYTTRNKNDMLISHDGRLYKVNIRELEEAEIELEHIDKYL